MDSPWKLVALSSVGLSIAIVQLIPQYSIATSYTWTFFAIFVVQLFSLFLWNVIIFPYLFSPFRHLPGPRPDSFINGNFATITRDSSGVPLQRWINEIPNDGLIHYRHLFNRSRLMVTSAKGLGEVLVQKNYDFIKPRMLREGISNILGVGLLLAEGDEHKLQRKNLLPAFAFRHVKDLYPIFWSKSCEMVRAVISEIQATEAQKSESEKRVQPSAVLEMSGWLTRVTLDIIGVAGMGQSFGAIEDPNTELNSTYGKLFKPSRQAQILNLLGFALPPWFIRALPVQRNNDIQSAAGIIRRVCRGLIEQKQRKLDQKEKTDVDILSVALESGGFTHENLVDQMMTFLAAGHETTSTATIWAIYALCQNPEVQRRLREEVRANLPSVNDLSTQVTSEVLDRMPYLHAVCSEVLRVYAPVAITIREAARDTSILGLFVPKGTMVILAPRALNMSNELWGPDAEKFNPERWLGPGNTNSGGAQSNYAFLTFLHGPRSCIGQAFAKAEFACLLASIVRGFEMELENKDAVIDVAGGITARPRHGLKVRMTVLDG